MDLQDLMRKVLSFKDALCLDNLGFRLESSVASVYPDVILPKVG